MGEHPSILRLGILLLWSAMPALWVPAFYPIDPLVFFAPTAAILVYPLTLPPYIAFTLLFGAFQALLIGCHSIAPIAFSLLFASFTLVALKEYFFDRALSTFMIFSGLWMLIAQLSQLLLFGEVRGIILTDLLFNCAFAGLFGVLWHLPMARLLFRHSRRHSAKMSWLARWLS